MSVIRLNNVSKYYGKNKGIEDLSLEINRGDIYGFIGPNGAGKSTTIRLLMNFIFPTSGDIRILEKDVLKHATELKRIIGYMPSEVQFYENLKVNDLLAYAGSLKKVQNKKRIQYLSDAFQLDVNRKFGELSFGNKKKVSIVQALMHEPEILILDEPTNGLDPLVQKTLLELLREENKKGTTIFFSSHTLAVVQKLCNRVGLIKDGKMLKTDSYDLIKKKRIKKVFIEAETLIHPDVFRKEGIQSLNVIENTAEFYYEGDLNRLFSTCNHLSIRDCSISEPDLEEVFMHFYASTGGVYES